MSAELDDRSFPRFVGGNRAAFVHFWANWNRHDGTMKAIISRVESDYLGRIAFGSLDVDQESTLAICAEHRVMGPPFYAYYREGHLIKTELGMLAERDLHSRLDGLISDPCAQP